MQITNGDSQLTKALSYHSGMQSRISNLVGASFSPLYEQWGHTNKKYVADMPDHQRWFIKVCDNPKNAVSDICEREVAASLLGFYLNASIISSRVIQMPTDLTQRLKPDSTSTMIRDRCVVMPLVHGCSLDRMSHSEKLLAQISEQVADLFAFSYWIGDDDRGIADVMFDNGKLVYVDNGLCGPSTNLRLRGAHPAEDTYSDRDIVLMCNRGKPSFVECAIGFAKLTESQLSSPQIIQRIKSMSDDAIRSIVNDSAVSYTGFASKLILRKASLDSDYACWLKKAVSLFL